MPFASFEHLCEGFCEIARMPKPTLEPDLHGALAFEAHIQDVPITVMELASIRPEVAYLMADCGPMPKDAAQAWRALLHANWHLRGKGGLAFSRNPKDGNAVLRRAVSFDSAAVTDIYQHAVLLAEMGQQWCKSPCFAASPAPWDSPAESTLPSQDRIEFIDGFEVEVRQPAAPDRSTLLRVPLYLLSSLDDQSDTLRMMDANFALMTNEWGAAFCRDPYSGMLSLQYALSHHESEHGASSDRMAKAVRHAVRWENKVAQQHCV